MMLVKMLLAPRQHDLCAASSKVFLILRSFSFGFFALYSSLFSRFVRHVVISGIKLGRFLLEHASAAEANYENHGQYHLGLFVKDSKSTVQVGLNNRFSLRKGAPDTNVPNKVFVHAKFNSHHVHTGDLKPEVHASMSDMHVV